MKKKVIKARIINSQFNDLINLVKYREKLNKLKKDIRISNIIFVFCIFLYLFIEIIIKDQRLFYTFLGVNFSCVLISLFYKSIVFFKLRNLGKMKYSELNYYLNYTTEQIERLSLKFTIDETKLK